MDKKLKFISPSDKNLQYTGRIDFSTPNEPCLVYACSSIKTRFSGTSIKALLRNHNNYWENYIAVFIDGVQSKIKLPDTSEKIFLTLAANLENKIHELILFKRMDACHHLDFLGFEIDSDADLFEPEQRPSRRIEAFGDSVTAGEVSEAIEFVGKSDPVNKGEFSNGYYSYAFLTAQKLGAEIHNNAQGGLALLDGTGWFNAESLMGLETTYDKIQYNPNLGGFKQWDFNSYIPHVVIIAIGQNDANPDNYMAQDISSEKSENWKKHYFNFVSTIRSKYPSSLIILSTTILNHNKNWDKAIDEVATKLNDNKIIHFLYSNNGAGTPGHIRIPEAEKMSQELTDFINSFGDAIWQD
jgi:hypothetical protein